MDTITIGLLIPFMGTLLGAATVFLLRDKMGTKFQKFLLGFASGVMIAASVWSLLIPAIEVSEGQSPPILVPNPATCAVGSEALRSKAFLAPFAARQAVRPVGERRIPRRKRSL